MTGSLKIKNETYYMVLNLKEGKKYKQKWVSTKLKTKGNKRKAQEMLNEYILQYQNEEQLNLKNKSTSVNPSESIKFTDYAEKWLEDKKGTVEQITWDGYYCSLSKHILPYFKKLNLDIKNIKPAHIAEYYNHQVRFGNCKNNGGLSQSALKSQRFIIKCIFNKAMSVDEIITKDPAKTVPLPKLCEKKEESRVFLNAQEANKLINIFEGHRLYPIIYLTIYCGLRRSEVLGLKWKAINFEENTLKIEHTVVKGLTIVRKDRTKSQSSARSYGVPERVCELFKRIKKEQAENKKLYGKQYIESDYVFTWDDGRPYRPDYITSAFQKVLKKNNLPHMRFHDLRHSCASILYDAGVGLKEIQKWLGHADIETTGNIYTHISKSREDLVSDKMDEMLKIAF